jgi:hypothetical protein
MAFKFLKKWSFAEQVNLYFNQFLTLTENTLNVQRFDTSFQSEHCNTDTILFPNFTKICSVVSKDIPR